MHRCFRLTIVNNFDSRSGRCPLENTFCSSFWWDLQFESKVLRKVLHAIINDADITVVSVGYIREE